MWLPETHSAAVTALMNGINLVRQNCTLCLGVSNAFAWAVMLDVG